MREIIFSFNTVIIVALFESGLAIIARLINKKKEFATAMLCIYVSTVLAITLGIRSTDVNSFLYANPLRTHIAIWRRCFSAIEMYGINGGIKSLISNEISIVELILNTLLFVPFGFLTPMVRKSFDEWWKILVAGFVFSLSIEATQYIANIGCFDASDLLHNSVGAAIGYMVYLKWLRESPIIERNL